MVCRAGADHWKSRVQCGREQAPVCTWLAEGLTDARDLVLGESKTKLAQNPLLYSEVKLNMLSSAYPGVTRVVPLTLRCRGYHEPQRR